MKKVTDKAPRPHLASPRSGEGHTYQRVSGEAVEYEVFARKTRLEPLHQVGSVVAPDDDLAAAYARATYDEERWIEMTIVRRDCVIPLWSPGES